MLTILYCKHVFRIIHSALVTAVNPLCAVACRQVLGMIMHFMQAMIVMTNSKEVLDCKLPAGRDSLLRDRPNIPFDVLSVDFNHY